MKLVVLEGVVVSIQVVDVFVYRGAVVTFAMLVMTGKVVELVYGGRIGVLVETGRGGTFVILYTGTVVGGISVPVRRSIEDVTLEIGERLLVSGW